MKMASSAMAFDATAKSVVLEMELPRLAGTGLGLP